MIPIYTIGMAWLALYVPADQLLVVGLMPFLLGDLVKIGIVAAASVAFPIFFSRLWSKGE